MNSTIVNFNNITYTLLSHKLKNTQLFHTIIVHKGINITASIQKLALSHTGLSLLGHSVNNVIHSALCEAISNVDQVPSQVIHVLN